MRTFQSTCIDWKSREKKCSNTHLCFAYKNMKGPFFHNHVNALEARYSSLVGNTRIDVPAIARGEEIIMKSLKRPIIESNLGNNKKRKEELPFQEIFSLHNQKYANLENFYEKIENMETSNDSLSCTMNKIGNLMYIDSPR